VQTAEPLNTFPIQQFIQAVKGADSSRAKEVKIDINTAKNLAFTLGIVMARLEGDLEKFVVDHTKTEDEEVISVTVDGGSGF
jgi:hypothetical protein